MDLEIHTLMFRVAIIPSPRPWNRAGVTEVVSMPLEVAHSVKASCSSPGHHSGFILYGFCASWQTLRSLFQVSIYYEMGFELERYTFVRTHLQMGLFYYILFSQVKKGLKGMFSSLETRRCVSEIHSTMWSRCRLSAINGVIAIYGRAQQPLMLSLPI